MSQLLSRSAEKTAIMPILLALFALSGAAGLIYEVAWVRQLTTVLGAGTYAVTIVLAAFMGGLGLGAWLCGDRVDRWPPRRLVRAYILCEIGIALYALAFPWLLAGAEQLYVIFFRSAAPAALTFHLFKLGLAFLLLAVPTVLMGATLPILGRYVIRRTGLADRQVAHLYAANTLGAILGTMASGFLLLPRIGIAGSVLVAVLLNLGAAAGLALLHRQVTATGDKGLAPPAPAAPPQPLSGYQRLALAGFALSGVAAMCYEVAWTRTLAMILGNTTYAFTTMLATFLLGIAAGSALYGLLAARLHRTTLFAWLQLAAGLGALLSIPLFEQLPLIYLSLYQQFIQSWPEMQLVRFALAALVMLPPTMALGATLPAASALLVDELGHLGRRVGSAYGLNTLGAVIGATLAGLLLVPAIGMQATIVFGCALNLLAGMALFMAAPRISRSRRLLPTATALAVALVVLASLQNWSPRIMNSGVYMYAPRYQKMQERYQALAADNDALASRSASELWRLAMKQYELLYYNPGVTATVAVMERDDGVRFLTIDGKTDASTGDKSDMRTQVMIAQLPMLFHPDPDEVLVVGLGSGVTAGAVLTHPAEKVDCAEISPAVIEAANFFSEANDGALDDPRLRLIPRDARNVLLTGGESYDVIVSQPSNPWIKGEASLFTEEWYRLVHSHLNRGGLFMQWVPSYMIGKQDLRIIAHTLRSVFPHLTVWTSGSVGDLIFLASRDRPLQIDFEEYLDKLQPAAVQTDLARVGVDPLAIPFQHLVMTGDELDAYLAGSETLPTNSDNFLPLEFSAPRQLVRRDRVPFFIDPENLLDDPKKGLQLIENIDPEQISLLLQDLSG